MDTETILFFEGHQAALPLYKTLVQKLKKHVPDAEIRVQKTRSVSTESICLAAFLFFRSENSGPNAF